MKDENEVVQVYELRGFVSRDLEGAFNEAYALSRGTKCDEFLYSLSLNPPPKEKIADQEFLATIEACEKRLNLSGQPRAIVFHEKNGRRHCHVVWSRIDAETMKARQQSFDKMKLTEYSRELFLQYGWEMPRGLKERGERDPRNYTHAEHQQAQRVGKHAGQIKEEIQSAWARSDTTAAFESALIEHGYMLARGDRRGFVVVDEHGEIYSLPRMLGIKTKEIRARLGDPERLPSVEDVQKIMAARREKAQAAAPEPKPEEKKKPTPERAFTEITRHHSAFTLKMANRSLKSALPDEKERLAMLDEILKRKDVKRLGLHKGQAVYASQAAIDIEKSMLETAKIMAQISAHKTEDFAVRQAIFNLDAKLAQKSNGAARLSFEQIDALKHMANDKQLSLIVGVAGAGKTTIMEGAKNALEAQGYRVRGAAPSGIAAASLKDIGMNASTLHALEGRIETAQKILDDNAGKPLSPKQSAFIQSALLNSKDVLIVDEAGMVSSRQMANVMKLCRQSGAKLVLVGDPEQLQSVEAGTAFRDLLDRNDSVAITEVRRQKTDRQRNASILLSQGQTAEALKSYNKHGAIAFAKKRSEAAQELVRDYMAAHDADPAKSRLVLAYTRKDVTALNAAIRAEFIKRGTVSAQNVELAVTVGDKTEPHHFAVNDRILFRENNAELGVMNGTFGTIEAVSETTLSVRLDNGKTVQFSPQDYAAFHHGYAATVHKSQGMTVDQTFVLASRHFDKHTTYVAMTRHKEAVKLYASASDFRNKNGLSNALGKDGEKISTLNFTDTRQKRNAPTFGRRIVGAAQNLRSRLFGQASEKTAKPEHLHRQTPTPEERDRVLSERIKTPPRTTHIYDDHLSPTNIDKKPDLAALRDEALRQAKQREQRQSAEQNNRNHYRPPTLER